MAFGSVCAVFKAWSGKELIRPSFVLAGKLNGDLHTRRALMQHVHALGATGKT